MRLSDENTREGRHLTPEERIALQAEEIKQLQQENERLNAAQVATLKAENEMLKSLTSDIPLDRLEEICKAYKEDRILILPKCPKCGLVNAWGIGKRNCDRCGANLNGGDV